MAFLAFLSVISHLTFLLSTFKLRWIRISELASLSHWIITMKHIFRYSSVRSEGYSKLTIMKTKPFGWDYERWPAERMNWWVACLQVTWMNFALTLCLHWFTVEKPVYKCTLLIPRHFVPSSLKSWDMRCFSENHLAALSKRLPQSICA